MKEIKGGVTAPQGFRANGVHAGVKAGSDPAKNDLALIFSEKECTAAATQQIFHSFRVGFVIIPPHKVNRVAALSVILVKPQIASDGNLLRSVPPLILRAGAF